MDAIFTASPSDRMEFDGFVFSVILLGSGGASIGVGIMNWGQGLETFVMVGPGLICLLWFLRLLFCIPRNYQLTPAAIVVWRWGPKVVIPLAEIRELRRVKLTKIISIGGVDGFFGRWGQFRTSDKSNGFGNFLAYITRNDTQVAIYRKKGDVVVLSPDQPEEFMGAVSKRLNSSEAN